MIPDEHDEQEDDGLAEIQAMLRHLPLRPPPPPLDRRVTAACHPWRRRLRWASAAAAILALALGSWTWHHASRRHADTPIAKSLDRRMPAVAVADTRPAGAAIVASLNPISITRTYGGISRDGIIGKTASGRPVERIRRQTVRQVLIVDPKRGTKVSITMPQEEVLVVPVRTF
jgi:hypothetical protein